jgi:lysophospholipase L1-like esterase
MTCDRSAARSVLLISGAAALLYVGLNVAWTAHRASGFPRFWAQQAAQEADANAIQLIALGDSATVAVGARNPMNGFVGRIATLIGHVTGRPVHITNRAVSGATVTDVLRDQVPGVDLDNADLVLYCSSNDLERRVPLPVYQASLSALIAHLPTTRTVFSDLPLIPGRAPYQTVLTDVTHQYAIARADFARIFTRTGRRLDIFSWLPPHLNDRGYHYWYEAFRPPVTHILQTNLVSRHPPEP